MVEIRVEGSPIIVTAHTKILSKQGAIDAGRAYAQAALLSIMPDFDEDEDGRSVSIMPLMKFPFRFSAEYRSQ